MCVIKHIFIGLLLMLVINASSCNDRVESAVRECGRHLTQFLAKQCVNGYNRKLESKKSDPLIDIVGFGNYVEPPRVLSSLFKDTFYADYNNLIAKTRRRRFDGVADECCLKSCTMSELLSYCL